LDHGIQKKLHFGRYPNIKYYSVSKPKNIIIILDLENAIGPGRAISPPESESLSVCCKYIECCWTLLLPGPAEHTRDCRQILVGDPFLLLKSQ
jgi:hypothetical protein